MERICSRLPPPPGFIDHPLPRQQYAGGSSSSSTSFLPQGGAAGPPTNIHFNQQSPTSAPPSNFPPPPQPSSDVAQPSSYGYATSRGPPSPAKNNRKSTRGRADGKKPTFIEKLFKVLQEPAIRPLMRWDPSGLHILIERPSELMTYFKRRNVFQQQLFSSFTRQLNIYGFMKRFTLEQAFPDTPPLPEGVNLQLWSHSYLTRDSTDEEILGFKRRVPDSPAVDGSEVDFPLDHQQDAYAYDPITRPYYNPPPPPPVPQPPPEPGPRYDSRPEHRAVVAVPYRGPWEDVYSRPVAGRFEADRGWNGEDQRQGEVGRPTVMKSSSFGGRQDSFSTRRPSTQEQYPPYPTQPPPTTTRLRYQPSAPQLRQTFQSQGRRLSHEPRSEDPLSPPGSAHHRHPLQPTFQQQSPPYQYQQLPLRHQTSFSSSTTSHSSSTYEGYPTPLLAPKSLRSLDYPLEDQALWQTIDYTSLSVDDSTNPPTFYLPPHKQPTPVPFPIPPAPRQSSSSHIHPTRFAYNPPPQPEFYEHNMYYEQEPQVEVGLVYAEEGTFVRGESQYATVSGGGGGIADFEEASGYPAPLPQPSLDQAGYPEEQQLHVPSSSSSYRYQDDRRG